MVQISENFELEKIVIDRLRKRVGPRNPLAKSVTKFVCCPRKTYFRFVGIPCLISDSTTLTFSRGRAHHEILEVFDPKEVDVEKDGIPGHIDMVYDHPVEIYTTIVSASAVEKVEDVPEVFPLKYKQLCAYVYMVASCPIKDGFIHEPGVGHLLPFHILGDYTRPVKPKIKVWTMIYTQAEMERNWNEILEKRDYIEQCMAEGKIPEWTGYDFECINCEFNPVCMGIMVREEKKEERLL